MRERVAVVTLSVCHFSILEKEPFSGLKLTSVHSRYVLLNVALFFLIEATGEKHPRESDDITRPSKRCRE